MGIIVDIVGAPFIPFWLFMFILGGLLVALYFSFRLEIKQGFVWFISLFRSQHHHHYQTAEKGIVHFGTKYGSLSVRMGDHEKTQEDIIAWLSKHHLVAPLDQKTAKKFFSRFAKKRK